MQQAQIRILIVEDHFVVRVGLKAIIDSQADMITVGEAGNGRQAIEQYELTAPDVTLMDLRIPGVDGIEAISAIVKRSPRARIIVLSTFSGDEDIFRALQAGARGYLVKDIKGQELLNAIRAVHSGQRPLPPEIASRLAERVHRSELSPRESEVLKLIAEGMSNRDIAVALNIGEGTVRVHASNIFAKLGCSDRAQAVSEAFRRGIIHLE